MLYDRARLGSDACDIQRKNLHDDRIRKQSQLVSDASSQSVVSTMEKFVNAVNEMNDHVILPTKLLDQEDSPQDNIPIMLRGGNSRYDFYHCLNIIKKDLVLGLSVDDEDTVNTPPDSGRASPLKIFKSPTRRSSTPNGPQSSENLPDRKISLQDLNTQESSVTGNSFQRQDSWASLKPLTEQQTSRRSSRSTIPEYHTQASCDSGGECEEDDGVVRSPVEIAEQLRGHLQGLQIGLIHLTKTAKYITKSIDQ